MQMGVSRISTSLLMWALALLSSYFSVSKASDVSGRLRKLNGSREVITYLAS